METLALSKAYSDLKEKYWQLKQLQEVDVIALSKTLEVCKEKHNETLKEVRVRGEKNAKLDSENSKLKARIKELENELLMLSENEIAILPKNDTKGVYVKINKYKKQLTLSEQYAGLYRAEHEINIKLREEIRQVKEQK